MMSTGYTTFVNRTEELEALERWWAKPGSGMGVVWGRKRVGKTWLLGRFARDRRAVFHTARNRARAAELEALSRAAAVVANTRRRSLAERVFRDWDDVFDVLAEAAESQPLLFVLDEFPELLKVEPHFESELRAIWERIAGTTNLKVLLCGSAVRTMEAIQAQDAELYGRADLRLQVQPFRPYEAALMLRDLVPAARAEAWGVCGGIPRYLALWDTNASFRDNLAALVCNEHGLLLSEGELVLADENLVGHRGERIPEQVLREVARGNTTFQAIRSAIRTLPTRGLDHLVSVRLLERVVPVTEDPARSRRTYYRLEDNFLAFWLRCVERYRDQIERGLGAMVLDVMLEDFSDFMGARWEAAFRDHMRLRAARAELGADVVAVGEWWRSQHQHTDDPCQLDVVALAGRKRRPVVVGEAKWATKVNGSSLLGGLKRKLVESRLADPDQVEFYVCARQQVTRSEGVHVVTAADIFG